MRRDLVLLLMTRFVRMFAYGLVSILLVVYLARIEFDERRIGMLLSLTLAGDLVISLWLTTHADRIGRRRVLMLGAGLMMLSGLVFVSSVWFPLLLVAAIVGVISPSGNEVGPFLPVEQAALSEEVDGPARTTLFAWYYLIGSVATALGALASGWGVGLAGSLGVSDVTAYRGAFGVYAGLGGLLLLLFVGVSGSVESKGRDATGPVLLGLTRSRGIVARLSALFALDAFAGGLVIQSFIAYWFHARFDADARQLGTLFFVVNLVAGASGLLAARISRSIGLVNTMVFTHIPSNVLLMLVPLMPTYEWAVAVLVLRFSISQMDVPTRQSFVASVVTPGERAAAGGVTNVVRSVGTLLAPLLAGAMFASPETMAWPFFICGGLKIVYDLLLLAGFRAYRGVGTG